MRFQVVAAAVLLALPLPTFANAQAPADSAPPRANPADVGSVDAIIAALYDVISGPASQPRDWTRFRSLFVPGARLIPTIHPPGATPRTAVMTPEQYAERAAAGFTRNGFFEREISRTADQFGAVTQLFSTYESRRAATDAKPFQRGINSIQLFNDGARWYIVSIFWDGERPDNPIPDKYLKR